MSHEIEVEPIYSIDRDLPGFQLKCSACGVLEKFWDDESFEHLHVVAQAHLANRAVAEFARRMQEKE